MRIAVLQALAVHVLLFLLLFAGLKWPRDEVAEAARGEPVAADMVDVSDLSASMQRALRRTPDELPEPVPEPAPEPLPEPVPDVVPEPEPVPVPVPPTLPPPEPDPAPVQQEKIQRDAPVPTREPKREQDEKRKKPDQAELDAKKLQEQERQKQQQLAEIRKQREQATRDRTMAEQRAQQLADARNPAPTAPIATRPPAGDPDSLSGKRAQYIVALMDAILRQWTRPESVRLGQVCQVLIRQIPGGEVVAVDISPGCPYDDQGRRSVEAAILKASPLPYAGFEDVFVRDPVLKFRAEDR